MQVISSNTTSTYKLERLLVLIGIAVCLIDCLIIWTVFSAHQPMWPLPDLYLMEMFAASILGLWVVWSSGSERPSLRCFLVWLAAGVLFGFVIIGAWSIGFFFTPVAGLFVIAALLLTRRLHESLLLHAGLGFAAALVQAALMLTVIRFL